MVVARELSFDKKMAFFLSVLERDVKPKLRIVVLQVIISP